MSKSEFENDQTLLSETDIRPQINYQTIAVLPFMTTIIFYQTLLWSYTNRRVWWWKNTWQSFLNMTLRQDYVSFCTKHSISWCINYCNMVRRWNFKDWTIRNSADGRYVAIRRAVVTTVMTGLFLSCLIREFAGNSSEKKEADSAPLGKKWNMLRIVIIIRKKTRKRSAFPQKYQCLSNKLTS